MTTATLDHVSVNTLANIYFDGKCVSHSITLTDGRKKSVGVILPSTLRFNTGVTETMECVAGACEYQLADSPNWSGIVAGQSFTIPANSYFSIRVTEGVVYHYICHFE